VSSLYSRFSERISFSIVSRNRNGFFQWSKCLRYFRSLLPLVLIGSHVNLPADDSATTRKVPLRQVWSGGRASVDGGRT
jgi:hypothetical protein